MYDCECVFVLNWQLAKTVEPFNVHLFSINIGLASSSTPFFNTAIPFFPCPATPSPTMQCVLPLLFPHSLRLLRLFPTDSAHILHANAHESMQRNVCCLCFAAAFLLPCPALPCPYPALPPHANGILLLAILKCTIHTTRTAPSLPNTLYQ